jgi:hypothetical protein
MNEPKTDVGNQTFRRPFITQFGLETLMIAGSGTGATAQVTDMSIFHYDQSLRDCRRLPQPDCESSAPQCLSQIGANQPTSPFRQPAGMENNDVRSFSGPPRFLAILALTDSASS